MEKDAKKITTFWEEDYLNSVVRKEQCKMLSAALTHFINRRPLNTSSRYSLSTPSFSCRNNRNVKWMLHLAENTGPDKNYISVTLELQSSDIRAMKVFFKCSLKKGSRKIHTVDTIFSTKHTKGNAIRIPRFFRKSVLADKRMTQLKLRCKVLALPKPGLYNSPRLASDLGALLRERTLADVTLLAAGKELRAHRAVLSARSPVFARMFQQDMREAREGRVRIDDVDHKVLAAFLHFAYTAQLEEQWEPLAGDLMAAADKYQFEELRRAAADLLLRRMNVRNAIDTVELAVRYDCAYLKRLSIDFINKHARQIVKTQAFKRLARTQPDLMAEIYSVMVMDVQDNEPINRLDEPLENLDNFGLSKNSCM